MKTRAVTDSPFAEVSGDELSRVAGGAGFLGDIYKNLVFDVGSQIGGGKLAEQMYGQRVTSGDKTRARAAMKQYLVQGNKLPKGAPHIFGD